MSVILLARGPDPGLETAVRALTRDDYLIVNADDAAVFPLLTHNTGQAQVLTYGLNAKACVTASSITESHVQVCIQRGFTGPRGLVNEPREFSAPIPQGAEAADVLAASAYGLVART